MFLDIIRAFLIWLGGMTLLVALMGIGLNWILCRNWYGETEEQRRERVRRERAEAKRDALHPSAH